MECDLIMPGTSTKRTAIDIKATTHVNTDIAHQLLPAHALSGRDTVSPLYVIGKGTVLKVLCLPLTLSSLGQLDVPMVRSGD